MTKKAREYIVWFSSRKYRTDLFNFFDTNKSGFISGPELKDCLNKISKELTDQPMKKENGLEYPWDHEIMENVLSEMIELETVMNMLQFCDFVYRDSAPVKEAGKPAIPIKRSDNFNSYQR